MSYFTETIKDKKIHLESKSSLLFIPSVFFSIVIQFLKFPRLEKSLFF